MKLTKFEIARILGARSLQISSGAYATIETKCDSSLKIAYEEIKQGKVPLKPIRPVKA
ncbi:TPA: DNA-directed RNA polymerase subunit K [Methanocaldococcus jannaschii]|uniref:DNA-directed RNA polymerase subunit Rpo6 n=2 Tax=Methanocaldococcus jannaschii TaxID=2190 RepID=RPO6_METJA|nr:DNA-directed RNA polymerase subunit K [Methanocaldococcus jannaschii]Q57650.1 RecName: Full=DNA-directed RNA polymerase subunit Rpo6; AltName: Full=DNA-directed RNA polymerase subunit K [Methanocaldococcus jannaschii DSM 2661]AAB98177.1 DNA-directed RNA polymerase, subunit K (rpoK) [Methanocaldococcus jannaschii DSM 2661]HII59257.1 DNA-directed RNA polymerase subunit K [Methanocaldococcus jannaschii]